MKKTLLIRAILILTISTLSGCCWSVGGDTKGETGATGATGAAGPTGAPGEPAPPADRY